MRTCGYGCTRARARTHTGTHTPSARQLTSFHRSNSRSPCHQQNAKEDLGVYSKRRNCCRKTTAAYSVLSQINSSVAAVEPVLAFLDLGARGGSVGTVKCCGVCSCFVNASFAVGWNQTFCVVLFSSSFYPSFLRCPLHSKFTRENTVPDCLTLVPVA